MRKNLVNVSRELGSESCAIAREELSKDNEKTKWEQAWGIQWIFNKNIQ